MSHGKAKLTPAGRLLLVERIEQQGWPAAHAAAMAGVAAVVVLAVGVRTSSNDAVSAVDLDSFADRHVARASVEPGFQVIPAMSPRGAAP